jgi:hypothetical protein
LFWRQFDAIHFVSFYALGYCAIAVGFRVPQGSGSWIIRPALAVLSPLVALAFVTTAYFCPVCSNPPGYPTWCEVGISGIPFPSRYFPTDLSFIGGPTTMTDSCGEWTAQPYWYVEFNAATFGNLLVGFSGLPLLLSLAKFRHKRSSPADKRSRTDEK